MAALVLLILLYPHDEMRNTVTTCAQAINRESMPSNTAMGRAGTVTRRKHASDPSMADEKQFTTACFRGAGWQGRRI